MNASRSILILGATSELGRASCLGLAREGHSISAWCADAPAAKRLLGADVTVHAPGRPGASLREVLERCDAVLDLSAALSSHADASLAPAELSAAWLRCATPPRHVVSVALPRDDDDASMRRASLLAIQRSGARLVTLHAGLILDPEEGLLRGLLRLGVVGAGGAPRSLSAEIPWIHRDDLVELAIQALDDSSLEGDVLAAAPQPVSPADLARAIAHAAGRDERALRVVTPSLLWRSLAGVSSGALTSRSTAITSSLQPSRVRLDAALADLLGPGCEIGPVTTNVDADYVRRRRPLRELNSRVELNASLDVVFPFFSRPENLCALTPRGLGFRILRGAEGGVHEGAIIDYLISLSGLPMPWRTRIDRWDPPHLFADSQSFGPYRCWWHEHRFTPVGARTVMNDRVLFAPLGGSLAQPIAGPQIESILKRIFSFRARGMRLRFGS